jgi:hypothetical protein
MNLQLESILQKRLEHGPTHHFHGLRDLRFRVDRKGLGFQPGRASLDRLVLWRRSPAGRRLTDNEHTIRVRPGSFPPAPPRASQGQVGRFARLNGGNFELRWRRFRWGRLRLTQALRRVAKACPCQHHSRSQQHSIHARSLLRRGHRSRWLLLLLNPECEPHG